ncbi:MAG: DUF2062 domain-containing protein [Candidatus Omnitrophota bacterium]
MQKPKFKSFKRYLIFSYIKLARINDTPQRIAFGLGLGAFLGILPGAGPLTALFLAFLLRANRAAALIGSLLTNTWLSFVMIIFAIKIGAGIMKVEWQDIYTEWVLFLKDFRPAHLFQISVLKFILPMAIGYTIIGIILGIIIYIISFLFIKRFKAIKEKRSLMHKKTSPLYKNG